MWPMEWQTFAYKKRYSIDKSLLSKVSSSSTLRGLKDRCFREANAFSDFSFAGETDNI